MIKSILCLTDFSPVAHNGLEYAANLAHLLSARLTLLYVRPTIWPEAVQLEPERERSNEEIASLLQRSCDTVKTELGVSCNGQLVTTTDTLAQAVATMSENFDLVVTGTSGADDYYQFLFGSHSFQILKLVKCPVLVVPQNYRFEQPKKIVYAYDPQTNPIFWVDSLMDFANSLQLAVSVFCVIEGERSDETERLLEVVRGAVLARSQKDVKWQFDSDFSKDVLWSIERYVAKNKPDLIALSYHHRSIAESLFKTNTIKQTVMTFDCPVLVFWH